MDAEANSPRDAVPAEGPSLETPLAALYRQSHARLLAFVRCRSTRGLNGRRDPEDILQSAFLQAQKRWDDFGRSGMAFEPWIFRLILNCLFDDHDYQSRQRRDYRAEVAWPDRSSMQCSLGLAAPGTTPSEAVARRDLQARIDQVLGRLAPDHQEILVMVHFGELTKQEAAEVLGIPSGTARQRYARARARFREVWKSCYGAQELGDQRLSIDEPSRSC